MAARKRSTAGEKGSGKGQGNERIAKVVLAYSGGLDTSVILKWLQETYGCQVVAFTADLGQGKELKDVEARALAAGASKVYVEDLKETFVKEYVFAALRANAVYEGGYLLGTSLARPLIAKEQMRVARKEHADAVAHGATGKGNDQVRFEMTYLALNPHIKIIAPWRQWDLGSRTALIEYAKSRGLAVPVSTARPYSTDRNIFHISYEGGILEDPWAEPPEDMFLLTRSPERAPDKPRYLEIDFERGDPVAVDGRRLGPVGLLTYLNKVAGDHGIGRVDLVENRFVGMKSRGVYETPGGTLLHAAHRALESITMDREVMFLRDSLIPEYARLVYFGFWFSPERELLQRMIDESQESVWGTVRLKLYKGSVQVVGRKSTRSMYHKEFATFERDSVYRQQDAEGFIRLNSLRLRIRSLMQRSAAGRKR
jgi:argininosuccinate synthase